MSGLRKALVVLLLVAAAATGLTTASTVNAATDDVGAFDQTKTIDRQFTDKGRPTRTVDSRDITVKVDHTKNLRGRERVQVSWSGARPSGGRAVNPFGENGLDQEYPVVVMQCRGRDDASLPAAAQLSPETCFSSTFGQRSQRGVPDAAAIWRADSFASDRDRSALGGVDALPKACASKDAPATGYSDYLTPFRPRKGASFPACSSSTMPPEAAVDASFPPAEQAAFTDLQGNGSTKFEVRSSIENASLGCDESTPCSIVVVPIEGLSCVQTGVGGVDRGCRATGRFEPGSSNFDGQGVDDAVSARYWWAASNWRNRISVPITFGAAPNVCDVTDSRPPVGFYGSELMTQASLQWAPAYCLRKDRFRFQHNVLPDQAAFNLMQSKEIPAAFVTGTKETADGSPTEYAPTAVTGYSVSYVIDKPDNAGAYTSLRLDARLLAKLLTQSYPASAYGQQHPGLAKNPLSLNLDPEFIALNPGLDRRDREAAAVIMNLSEESDVITALTSYIADDPEAAAFIAGKADPWGMTINPTYRGIKVPRSKWPLLDEFKPAVAQKCLQVNNDTAYLSRLAAPVTSFAKIANALLDAWPLAQTKCSGDGSTQAPFVLGRGDRQGVGSRFVLGITTLGDARRLGLDQAALQTTSVRSAKPATFAAGRTFVGPTEQTMATAVRTARATRRGAPFSLDVGRIRATKNAYPGTLVVYTAAKTSGLDAKTAGTVAQFIRISSTEGQRRGSGNGFLPDGYVPIRKTGDTAALWASAQQVASDVAGQVGRTSGTGGSGDGSPGGAATGTGGGAAGTSDVAASSDDSPQDAAKAPVKDDQLQSLADTPDVGSPLGGWLIPLMILLALGCGLAAPLMRILSARKVSR